MKVLMTARWVERFAKLFQQEFPQVEFVYAETAEEMRRRQRTPRSRSAR